MIATLPRWAIAATNVVAWGVFHATTGYAVHRLPAARLGHDGPVLRLRRWEREGRVYDRVRIKRWKDRLPEAGALFTAGVSKRSLGGDLERFVVETRRAERGHWLAMACGPLAVLWNPPGGAIAMVAYGVVANAPFIAVQRYNRARALRVLARSRRSAPRASAGRPERTSGRSMP